MPTLWDQERAPRGGWAGAGTDAAAGSPGAKHKRDRAEGRARANEIAEGGRRRRAQTADESAAGRRRLILLLTFTLYCFGLVMVTSATSGTSLLGDGDPWMYLKRQLLWGAIGSVGLYVALKARLSLVERAVPLVLGFATLLLFVVFIPGIGQTINGANRWLVIGPFSAQPSELVKFAVVLYIARHLGRHRAPRKFVATVVGMARSGEFMRSPAVRAGFLCAVIFIQRDLGTAMVTGAAVVTLYLVCGTPWRDVGWPVGIMTTLVVLGIAFEPYRRDRFLAFLDPWDDPHGTGFQLVQGLIAIGSGGPFGVGLGHSVQKIHYVPEAHTDMIFAITAEELGLIGVGLVLFCFIALALVGLRVAQRSTHRFHALLAVGLTAMLCGQAVLNIAGVVGVLPLTGVPLPLVSYGGSSLLITFISLGLLANLATAESGAPRKPVAATRKHQGARGGGGHSRAPRASAGRR